MNNKCDTFHGVFLDVFGTGVLITGKSGIGKSELALSLIHQGHRLIADDYVEFHLDRSNGLSVIGSAPELSRNFLEVRGLGILNIEILFGVNAVTKSHPLNLIIEIKEFSAAELTELDRFKGLIQQKSILGQLITQYTVPLNPSRNLVVLIETAVRKYQLNGTGYDASLQFCKQQSGLIQEETL